MPVIVQRLNYTAHNVNNNQNQNDLHSKQSKSRVTYNNNNNKDEINLSKSQKTEECESLIVNIDSGLVASYGNLASIDKINKQESIYEINDINNNNNIISDSNNNNNNKKKSNNKNNYTNKLNKKKRLFEKRRHLSDLCSFFAMSGIFLMIIEAELILNAIFEKGSNGSNAIKILISISTLILIVLLIAYHQVQIKVNKFLKYLFKIRS
jgi:hypothetical protein